MKRKLMILTLLCLLMVALAVCVSAETVKNGSCGENITWTLDDAGTLTLTGTGEMDYYNYGEVPWFNEKEQIKKLVVSEQSPPSKFRQVLRRLESVPLPAAITSGRSNSKEDPPGSAADPLQR